MEESVGQWSDVEGGKEEPERGSQKRKIIKTKTKIVNRDHHEKGDGLLAPVFALLALLFLAPLICSRAFCNGITC